LIIVFRNTAFQDDSRARQQLFLKVLALLTATHHNPQTAVRCDFYIEDADYLHPEEEVTRLLWLAAAAVQ
jgi:hypothetical protein